MRAAQIRVGDVVEVDVRGTVFLARVQEFRPQRRISIEPLVSWCTYYSARLRDVRRRIDPPIGGRCSERRPIDETLDRYTAELRLRSLAPGQSRRAA